jgi:hypothetical protein
LPNEYLYLQREMTDLHAAEVLGRASLFLGSYVTIARALRSRQRTRTASPGTVNEVRNVNNLPIAPSKVANIVGIADPPPNCSLGERMNALNIHIIDQKPCQATKAFRDPSPEAELTRSSARVSGVTSSGIMTFSCACALNSPNFSVPNNVCFGLRALSSPLTRGAVGLPGAATLASPARPNVTSTAAIRGTNP